jgi:hypothetical protein
MLQPDLSSRDADPAECKDESDDGVRQRAGTMKSCDQEHGPVAVVEAALHEAQRARVLSFEILQVVPAREEQRTGRRGGHRTARDSTSS